MNFFKSLPLFELITLMCSYSLIVARNKNLLLVKSTEFRNRHHIPDDVSERTFLNFLRST